MPRTAHEAAREAAPISREPAAALASYALGRDRYFACGGGSADTVSARRRRSYCISQRMVLHHRWVQGATATLRRPGELFPIARAWPIEPSAFAPRQLLFAQRAIAEPATWQAAPRPARGGAGLRARRRGGHTYLRYGSTIGRSGSSETSTSRRSCARFQFELRFAACKPSCCRSEVFRARAKHRQRHSLLSSRSLPVSGSVARRWQ